MMFDEDENLDAPGPMRVVDHPAMFRAADYG